MWTQLSAMVSRVLESLTECEKMVVTGAIIIMGLVVLDAVVQAMSDYVFAFFKANNIQIGIAKLVISLIITSLSICFASFTIWRQVAHGGGPDTQSITDETPILGVCEVESRRLSFGATPSIPSVPNPRSGLDSTNSSGQSANQQANSTIPQKLKTGLITGVTVVQSIPPRISKDPLTRKRKREMEKTDTIENNSTDTNANDSDIDEPLLVDDDNNDDSTIHYDLRQRCYKIFMEKFAQVDTITKPDDDLTYLAPPSLDGESALTEKYFNCFSWNWARKPDHGTSKGYSFMDESSENYIAELFQRGEEKKGAKMSSEQMHEALCSRILNLDGSDIHPKKVHFLPGGSEISNVISKLSQKKNNKGGQLPLGSDENAQTTSSRGKGKSTMSATLINELRNIWNNHIKEKGKAPTLVYAKEIFHEACRGKEFDGYPPTTAALEREIKLLRDSSTK